MTQVQAQPQDPTLDLDLDLDLDSLLAESVQQVADRKASQALLSRIRQGRATEAERGQVAQVELKAAWVAVANCEMWHQTSCECGESHAIFSQYMIEYRPQGNGNSHRWVRAEPEELVKGLKTKAIYSIRDVSHCSVCSDPPEGAEIVIWADGHPSQPKLIEDEAGQGE